MLCIALGVRHIRHREAPDRNFGGSDSKLHKFQRMFFARIAKKAIYLSFLSRFSCYVYLANSKIVPAFPGFRA